MSKNRELTPEEQMAIFDSFDDGSYAVQGISPVLDEGIGESMDEMINNVLSGSSKRAFDMVEVVNESMEERLSMFGESEEGIDMIRDVLESVDEDLSYGNSTNDAMETTKHAEVHQIENEFYGDCTCTCDHHEEYEDKCDEMEVEDESGVISIDIPDTVFPLIRYSSFGKIITLDKDVVDFDNPRYRTFDSKYSNMVMTTSLSKIFKPTLLLDTEEMLKIAEEFPEMSSNIIFNQRELVDYEPNDEGDPRIIFEAFVFTDEVFTVMGEITDKIHLAERLFNLSNSALKRNLMLDYTDTIETGDETYSSVYSLTYEDIKSVIKTFIDNSESPKYRMDVKELLNNAMMEAESIEELIDIYESNPKGLFKDNIDPETGDFVDPNETVLVKDVIGNTTTANSGNSMVIEKRL